MAPPVKKRSTSATQSDPRKKAALPSNRVLRSHMLRPGATLTTLPSELFQKIVRCVVEDPQSTIRASLHVRLVSRLFNREIVAELFWGGVLDRNQDWGFWERMPSSWRVRLLRNLAMAERFSKRRHRVDILIGIGEVVDAILNYKADYSQQAELHISTEVCTLIVAHVAPLWLLWSAHDQTNVDSWNEVKINGAVICVAAWMGDENMYQHFYDKLNGIHTVQVHFGSAMWAAAYNAHTQLLEKLRRFSFTVWDTNSGTDSMTVMAAACRLMTEAHQDAVYTVLQLCIHSQSYRDYDMTRCTGYAVQTGNRKILELLTRQCYLKTLEEQLGMAMCDLCRVGEARSLIAFLLDRGVDPDARKYLAGNPAEPPLNTPLIDAVERQDVQLARLLLDHGAHPDALGHNTTPALSFAIRQNNLELVDLLLLNGASPALYWEHSGRLEYCALHEAFTLGHFEAISIILNFISLPHDAEADTRAYQVLLLATEHGNIDIIRRLVSAGCSVHARYGDPIRPPPNISTIHCPPGDQKNNSASTSLTHPVDWTTRRRHQTMRPAIEVALENGNLAAAQLLQSLGSKMSYAKEEMEREDGEWVPVVSSSSGSTDTAPQEERRMTRAAKKKAMILTDWRSKHSRREDETPK